MNSVCVGHFYELIFLQTIFRVIDRIEWLELEMDLIGRIWQKWICIRKSKFFTTKQVREYDQWNCANEVISALLKRKIKTKNTLWSVDVLTFCEFYL